MQRIIRRAALAKQRAHRKNREALSKRKYDEVHAYVREIAQVRKAQTDHLKNARKNQREDWKLGPLAPRRDVGDNKEAYGTVEASIIQNPIVPRHRRMPRPCIYEGDRVVILEGPDEGKIGLVRNVDKMEETVTVLEKNLYDVPVPAWLQKAKSVDKATQTYEKPVHMSKVRLVYPLPDPVTGVPRDVIIDRFEDNGARGRMRRRIYGTNIDIPIPRDSPEKEYEDNDGDTLRIHVDQETWTPQLFTPPMPRSVLDELRNKYSKFRTRHDKEFVEKNVAKDDAVQRRKESVKSMWTPRMEAADRRAREKKEPEPLREETLAGIGEIIARARGLRLDAI